MNRPNIVFYFSDQQRWDTLGCYGQELPVSPNLDALAAEGVRFASAYTCQPVCGPARACLQTGRYATQTGCYRNAIELPSNIKPLAAYFNEAGYDTAYVGKWHLASNKEKGIDHTRGPIPRELMGGYKDYWMASDVLEFTSHGYDGYVFDIDGNRHDFIGYRADCINNYAIHYLQNRETNNPFFLFISQIEPHHQNDHGRFEGPDGSKERFRDFRAPGDLLGTQGDWWDNYPDYLGQCANLDENIGRLIATLKEQGVWENTILFYTSDHGCHFTTRNKEYKRSCHDGCTHLPMIACGPGFRGGRVMDEMVSLIDIPTTLLDCAGIEKPDGFQGNSLKQLCAGRNQSWPQEVFMQISESQVSRAIRTKDWKYCVRADADGWAESGADVYYEYYLYDLNGDPYEKQNLAEDPALAEVRAELRGRLCEYMSLAQEEVPQIRPASEMPSSLRSLFCLGL